MYDADETQRLSYVGVHGVVSVRRQFYRIVTARAVHIKIWLWLQLKNH